MSDIIHLLPDHIANQIAAGEVIQRPASVVKELMENSVDAGAKNISVNIKDAGRTLIQVIDDGKGMTETDARMAFERHATSKISSVDDLFSLRTMGFRGEALASIAAVAQVELRTRVNGSDLGTRLAISGSTLDLVESDACPQGSVMSVKNLFYNVPARRKFLKSNETEFRNILAEFERVVLVNPDISFSLYHDDALVYELPSGLLRQRVSDVFGKGMNQKLLSLEVETSLAKIRGFTGSLDSVKKRGNLQFFFVNGRYMRHPYFHKAVMQAYEQLIPTGESPDYFIYFTLDPSSIDVNIHPTKTEIKFENERPLWQILFSVVREVLAKSNSVPTIDFDSSGLIEMPVYNPSGKDFLTAEKPKLSRNEDYNPFRDLTDKRPQDEWKALYEGFEKDKTTTETKIFASSLSSEDTADTSFFKNDVSNQYFQYKSRFIITPLKSGLVIIDQHRAHVRILYERFMEYINSHGSISQKLLFPEIVEFTAGELSLLSSLADDIKYLGFDLDFMGGNSYAINAVPSDVSTGNPAALVKDILAAAAENGVSGKEKKHEKMAMSLAKTTAIKVGKPLSQEEMGTLIASLFALENNGLTPDGQIILTILSDDELLKRL
ncbi:MAG: DNA mismatch repair endonuclease MutL [Tannerella sp.]|jgi:DNA mismatch repair protein MutL|nr:DNA mismatch repair endonuclease MutL [Tannerella sp.]